MFRTLRRTIRICLSVRSICSVRWHIALARRAAGARSATTFGTAASSTRGSAKWRSFRSGYLARAAYEWSHHVKIGHDFGVSDDDIRAIIAETEGHATTLDPFDKTVLKAAREMASELAITDATFAALQEKLDTELLTDLVLTIAFYCAVVRVLATMQIDVEDDYLPYLKQFPLPKD